MQCIGPDQRKTPIHRQGGISLSAYLESVLRTPSYVAKCYRLSGSNRAGTTVADITATHSVLRIFSHIFSLACEFSFMYSLSSLLGFIGTFKTTGSKAFPIQRSRICPVGIASPSWLFNLINFFGFYIENRRTVIEQTCFLYPFNLRFDKGSFAIMQPVLVGR